MNLLTVSEPVPRPLPGRGASVTRAFVRRNPLGLHARPAALLVRTVQPLACRVMVESGGQAVDARSIWGLLALAAARAMDAIQRLFDSNFNAAY